VELSCYEHKATCTFCLSTTMKNMVSFTIQSPYPYKNSPLCALDRQLEGHYISWTWWQGGTESPYAACKQSTLLFKLSKLFTKHFINVKFFTNLENIYYHLVQNRLKFHLRSKFIYEIIILLAVLYEYDTWFPTLWKEHRLEGARNIIWT
jgi:hypothetical protein